MGAKIASEVIIPESCYIILNLPRTKTQTGGPAWDIMAVKMMDDNDNISKVVDQSAILMEFGREMVADVSAVDGINFKVKQEVSIGYLSDGTLKIHKMDIK